ncbi:MAG: hypothetical protein DRI88_13275 [Bacteroidetes bacterium]|nr:MAG: hypothetical protein DRI88_13275 [Bacteroidota bacterium]
MKLAVDKTLGTREFSGLFEDVRLVNPAGSYLDIRLWGKEQSVMELSIYNVLGEPVMNESIHLNRGENHIVRSIQNLKPGMYFVRISDKNSNMLVRKLLKY